MLGLYRSTLASQPFVSTISVATTSSARRAFTRTGQIRASLEKLNKTNHGTPPSPPPLTSTAPPSSSATAAATASMAVHRGGSSASSSLLSFPKDHPFTFQLIVATVKTMAADLMVQMVAEGKSLTEIDWKRNGIFVVFGFTYLGGFQYYLMVHKYRQWFPTMDKFAKLSFAEKLKYPAGIFDAGKMVLFDIIVHLPMLYFPTYYTVKEFVSGHSWNPTDWIQDGITKYSKNIVEDLTAMVQLWGPSDCIQFILPIHMRMPFRHLVSFFWTAYVSFTRGAIVPTVPTTTTE